MTHTYRISYETIWYTGKAGGGTEDIDARTEPLAIGEFWKIAKQKFLTWRVRGIRITDVKHIGQVD